MCALILASVMSFQISTTWSAPPKPSAKTVYVQRAMTRANAQAAGRMGWVVTGWAYNPAYPNAAAAAQAAKFFGLPPWCQDPTIPYGAIGVATWEVIP